MKGEITYKLLFDDYDQTRTSSFGSAGDIRENEAVLFINPTKYSLDKEDLQSYINGSRYEDYGSENEIVAEEPKYSKDDLEYKALAETIQKLDSTNAYNLINVEPHLIQKEISLAYRDKKLYKCISRTPREYTSILNTFLSV